MPYFQAKGLTCHVERGPSNTPMHEYGSKVTDHVVETYLQVPSTPLEFSIHLVSNRFIAPGLAMFVFIDGVYQCNRNRRDLVCPSPWTKRNEYEVDMRVRKEETQFPDTSYIGRFWRFEKIKPVDDNNPTQEEREYKENVGIIEVVVLRCHASGQPRSPEADEYLIPGLPIQSDDGARLDHSLMSLSLDGANDEPDDNDRGRSRQQAQPPHFPYAPTAPYWPGYMPGPPPQHFMPTYMPQPPPFYPYMSGALPPVGFGAGYAYPGPMPGGWISTSGEYSHGQTESSEAEPSAGAEADTTGSNAGLKSKSGAKGKDPKGDNWGKTEADAWKDEPTGQSDDKIGGDDGWGNTGEPSQTDQGIEAAADDNADGQASNDDWAQNNDSWTGNDDNQPTDPPQSPGADAGWGDEAKGSGEQAAADQGKDQADEEANQGSNDWAAGDLNTTFGGTGNGDDNWVSNDTSKPDAAGDNSGWDNPNDNTWGAASTGWDDTAKPQQYKSEPTTATADATTPEPPTDEPRPARTANAPDSITPDPTKPKPYWPTWSAAFQARRDTAATSPPARTTPLPTYTDPVLGTTHPLEPTERMLTSAEYRAAYDPRYAERAKPRITPAGARPAHATHFVQPGAGVHYAHDIVRPAYADSMARPYAVFRFRYCGTRRIRAVFGEHGVAAAEERIARPRFRERVSNWSRAQVVEELMRVRAGLGLESDESYDTDSGSEEEEGEGEAEKKTVDDGSW